MSEQATRVRRADAVRNRDALLETAKRLFADRGSEVTFEDVARAAGVGKGTLYRHFANRDQLIAAVLRDRFDTLTAEAERLATRHEPDVAVDTWLRSFDSYPTSDRSLAASISEGLTDARSAVSTACTPMKDAFTRLLATAQESGSVRHDVDAQQLLTVIAGLPDGHRDETGSSPFLDVVLRGIR